MKLTIFSWNIGDNSDKIINMIEKKKDKLHNILIFGFQEASVKLIYNNQYYNILNNYLKKKGYQSLSFNDKKIFSTCKTLKSRIGQFGICILVFYKNIMDIEIVDYKKNCVTGTKGYSAICLKINNNYLDIINTHMPFTPNKEKYEKFSINLERWLKNERFTSENRILFGDLNSRSLLTDTCLDKNIQLCEDNNFDKNYCKISEFLENLKFKDTIKNYLTNPINTKNCNITKDDCRIKGDIKINKYNIVDILRKNDFLGNPPNELSSCGHIPNKYLEQNITFLPTYKRDTKKGIFSLKKGRFGRLPGYADRIIYKTKNYLNPIEYNLIGVIGNDHLPLYKVFELKDSNINDNKSKKRMGFKRVNSKKLNFKSLLNQRI